MPKIFIKHEKKDLNTLSQAQAIMMPESRLNKNYVKIIYQKKKGNESDKKIA